MVRRMSKVTISRATLRDTTWIGAQMQAGDRREIMCQMPPGALASEAAALCWQASPMARWQAEIDGEPVAAWGAMILTYPVWQAWAFGTRRMRRAIPAMRRHIVAAVPEIVALGARRLEVRAMSGHSTAHLLLISLGAKYACELPFSGHGGEVFELWFWTVENRPHVLRKRPQNARPDPAAQAGDG